MSVRGARGPASDTGVTIHNDEHVFRRPVTFESGARFGDDEAAPLIKYVSQEITLAGAVSGQTHVVALTGEVDGWIPQSVTVHTKSTVGNGGNSATSGCTVEVGTAGDPDGYMVAASAYGTAGPKSGAKGALLTGAARTDALQLTVTATAVTGDVLHLTGFAAKVVITYFKPSTTYPTT